MQRKYVIFGALTSLLLVSFVGGTASFSSVSALIQATWALPASRPASRVVRHHKKHAQTTASSLYRPLIIGHRGASGSLPEHTLAAYRLAIQHGADYIEPDLVSTRDGVLVARHENEISQTTDVAQRFPRRRTTKVIDGRKVTGFFTEDFTLKELKTLRAKERLPFRGQAHNGRYPIPTFDEILQMLREVNRQSGKVIGVYPETKHPSYFRSIDLPLEPRLLKSLRKFGLDRVDAPVFIQSFEVGNLQQLHRQTRVRLIQLISLPRYRPYDFVLQKDKRTFGDLLRDEGLKQIARYAYGIGPWKGLLLKRQGKRLVPSGLVRRAHQAGLRVHPYTFRNEKRFRIKGLADPIREYHLFFRMGVDGLFSDHPHTAVEAVQRFVQPTTRPGATR